MKRKIAFMLICCFFILTTGCYGSVGTSIVEQPEQKSSGNPSGETTKNSTTEPTKESTPQPTKEPTPQPTEETTPQPTKEIVTDSVVISGMAKDILKHMTIEEKVGQLFMVDFESLDKTKGSYYEFREITDEMKESLQKYHVGGIVFFGRNIENREQTKTLIEEVQKESKYPLFIGVDEEGGDVARIANNENMKTTKFPTMEEVGSMNDSEYAYNMGATIGKEVKELGFNLDFAPVADVRTNENNKEIGSRSFGDSAKLVSKMVKEVVNGLQDQNVSATLKHFPGHGSAGEDTHEGSVNIDNDLNRLRQVDFVPFKAGIKAGVDFIMVSHVSISRVTENIVPATLSSLVMKTMLRDELGFHGIILTDAMDMKAITETYTSQEAAIGAIEAGADIVVIPDNFEEAYHAVLSAVEEGTLEEERIDESVERILETKIKRGLILSDTELIGSTTEPEHTQLPTDSPKPSRLPEGTSESKETSKPKKSTSDSKTSKETTKKGQKSKKSTKEKKQESEQPAEK